MIKTYTSRNQFNYSIKQVEIDYTKRTFIVRFGGQCHIDFENKLYISMKYNDLCNSTLNNYDVVYVQANEDIKIIQGICKQENYAEVE